METKTEPPVDFNPYNTREIEYEKDLGAPGEFPYTRGIYPNMYRGRSGPCASTPATPAPRNRTSLQISPRARHDRAFRNFQTAKWKNGDGLLYLCPERFDLRI